jgi:hypothetical protein
MLEQATAFMKIFNILCQPHSNNEHSCSVCAWMNLPQCRNKLHSKKTYEILYRLVLYVRPAVVLTRLILGSKNFNLKYTTVCIPNYSQDFTKFCYCYPRVRSPLLGITDSKKSDFIRRYAVQNVPSDCHIWKI